MSHSELVSRLAQPADGKIVLLVLDGFGDIRTADQPETAVLYRGLRWRRLGFLSIFVLFFGGAGFGLLGWLVIAGRREAEGRRPRYEASTPR